MKDLHNVISKIINYEFTDSAILEEALTHPSVNKRNDKNQIVSYERLEFLGDSVLNMVISAMLFKLFPDEKEGALAKRKTDLVCGSTITHVAKEIELNNFIIMNNSERCNGGRSNAKNLENTLEALIGAIYIDGGFASAEKFVTQHWEELAKNIQTPPQDPKTSLQEWTQKNKLPLPEYELIKQTGPAHNPEFTISVCIENYGKASARATSKKVAEQKAAELMLEKIERSGSV
ncbi:ribonuclease III [Wolbachia endosymbiont of Ctenocephalides felis wCfeT]|uniref:ribonuclease III n=1 Tax=Wolbachia endosymbiont of Ctenocephalides felis wCfeT TaxID=2732593 RepID=UPI0014477503|nr:ribonuclease III [Wolbachia endosymbiont of Ctenocephalides felis wCfeT]